MKENPMLIQKRERINTMLSWVKTMKAVEVEKLLAMAEMQIGLGKETARSYMLSLRNAGFIEIKNGEVLIKKG